MNRNDILQFLKTKQINLTLANEMVQGFAKSLGKTDEQIVELLKQCQNPELMEIAISRSIPYYLREYTICSVIDSKTGKIYLYY